MLSLSQCSDPWTEKASQKQLKFPLSWNASEIQLAMHYDFEMETIETGQKDSQAFTNTLCVVLVGYLVFKLDRDQIWLYVCYTH